jgi:hypothetical protein
MSTVQRTAGITQLRPGQASPGRAGARTDLIALAVSLALAVSPLAFGYYNFTSWAPLGIGAVVLLVVLAFTPPAQMTSFGRLSAAGLLLLTGLSFASILWAESRDSAWTAANQAAVYGVVLAVGLLAIRRLATARAVLLVLGLPALISSLVLAVEFVLGGGGGAFLQGRLQSPMGYINGTAGLMVMGIWPWLGLAERTRSRWLRSSAISAAALIAATAVLTQSRAIVLATIVTVVLVLIAAPGRTRRGVHLMIVAAASAATAHWTLRVYSSSGRAQLLTPSAGAIRQAGLALIGAALVGAALSSAASWVAGRVARDRRPAVARRVGQAMLVVSVALVVAGVITGHQRITTQWHDFTALQGERSAGNRFLALGGGYRYDLWRIALDEFRGDPLGGVGAGNYVDQYYVRRHQLEDVTVPHSLELQMLAELGVGGGLALVLLLAGVLGAGLAGRSTLAGADPGVRVAALGVFTAWLAATSVDWLYDIPGLTGMALLAGAILVAPAERERDAAGAAPASGPAGAAMPAGPAGNSTEPRTPIGRRVGLVGALGLLALVAASLGRQYVAVLYSNSGQALVAGRPLVALQKLETAEQLDPWSIQTQYTVASAYARLHDYGAARAALLDAQQMEPENYVPPALLGDIATRAGDRVAALADYRRALALDPLEPTLRGAVEQREGRSR